MAGLKLRDMPTDQIQKQLLRQLRWYERRLLQYGQHTPTCTSRTTPGECNCGWKLALQTTMRRGSDNYGRRD